MKRIPLIRWDEIVRKNSIVPRAEQGGSLDELQSGGEEAEVRRVKVFTMADIGGASFREGPRV